MTDIFDNLVTINGVGNDHEDIQKLFPKCKPKSDINLNKISSSKHVYCNRNSIVDVPINCNDDIIVNDHNDFLAQRRLYHCHGLISSPFLTNRYNENLLYSSEHQVDQAPVSPSNSSSDSNSGGDSSVISPASRVLTQFNKTQEDHMVVDESVVRAYDHQPYKDMESNGHKTIVEHNDEVEQQEQQQNQNADDDEPVDDESLDVGYRIPVMREEFKLRESRIEIAGGREVFSVSRSRPSKKRFNDEIQYRPSVDYQKHRHQNNHRELKRNSDEVMWNGEERPAGSFHLSKVTLPKKSSATCQPANGQFTSIKHNRSKSRSTPGARKLNKVVCNVDDSPSDPLYNRMSMEKNGHGIVSGGKSLDLTDNDAVVDVSGSKQRDTFVLKGQRSGMFIYETVVRGSSEVVYDDIEDRIDLNTTNNLRDQDHRSNSEEANIIEKNDLKIGHVNFPKKQVGQTTISEPYPVSTMSLEEIRVIKNGGRCSPGSENFSLTQLIGNLPIAQYEGSPRRYGPRPGYPQRMTMVSESVDGVELSNDDTSIGEKTIGESVENSQDDSHGSDDQILLSDGNNFGHDVDSGYTNGGHGSESSFSNYDYLYEESETRKVLEEFYHQDGIFARLKEAAGSMSAEAFNELEYKLYRNQSGNSYVGRRLAQSNGLGEFEDSPKKRRPSVTTDRVQMLREHLLAATLNSIAGSVNDKQCLSKENLHNFNMELVGLQSITQDDQPGSNSEPGGVSVGGVTEKISTIPDAEDLTETEVGEQVGQSRNFTLSPETTECDSNDVESEVSMENDGSLHSSNRQYASMPVLEDGLSSGHSSDGDHREEHDDDDDDENDDDDDGGRSGSDIGGGRGGERRRSTDHHVLTTLMMKKQISEIECEIARLAHNRSEKTVNHELPKHFHQQPHVQPSPVDYREVEDYLRRCDAVPYIALPRDRTVSINDSNNDHHLHGHVTNPLKETTSSSLTKPIQRPLNSSITCESVSEAIDEIKQAIQRTKSITLKSPPMEKPEGDNVPVWVLRPTFKQKSVKDEDGRTKEEGHEEDECDTDQETDRLLGKQRNDDPDSCEAKRLSDLPSTQQQSSPITNADPLENLPSQEKEAQKKKGRTKEVLIHEPAVLIEGVLFRARYLGSTQLVCEGQPTKATRMMQAEEAVSSIKAPEGETQPSTEVDLFISTEKIMVLNTDLKEIMMDHALRTISYIADIGDLVVLMARRRVMSTTDDVETKMRRTPKMICHVFESEEAQFIAQSIGQAFQVAYMEFLKANGIEDHSFVKEMDYQEVLNSQEIFGDELEMFAKKEMQKEVIVPKLKGEIFGVVIVESGWGSMLPTVVIANLSPNGAAARCGQLNIGDQIIAVNGISLVGLPLSTCQNYVKNAKNQTVVKLTVVPCAPVVEVKIKRPDTKYQLGFSVQNGVICSLLRGGIAERGGVRVGHRIIEINGQSVVAVPHERIVNLLATSVGEVVPSLWIHMKTMPTSMFRLLTGQESPIFI